MKKRFTDRQRCLSYASTLPRGLGQDLPMDAGAVGLAEALVVFREGLARFEVGGIEPDYAFQPKRRLALFTAAAKDFGDGKADVRIDRAIVELLRELADFRQVGFDLLESLLGAGGFRRVAQAAQTDEELVVGIVLAGGERCRF